MIAFGACLVTDPEVGFYREIRPLPGMPWDSAAERVHRLTPAHLEELGLEPPQAMLDLDGWLQEVASGRHAVFVGFNAAFDWMFVADYFHRFLGTNPFGTSALDQKAYFMAKHLVPAWSATGKETVRRRYPTALPHTHHALDDAREQAELMRQLLEHRRP